MQAKQQEFVPFDITSRPSNPSHIPQDYQPPSSANIYISGTG
jgi:hypothetical protein